jgi:hypothetical protein
MQVAQQLGKSLWSPPVWKAAVLTKDTDIIVYQVRLHIRTKCQRASSKL